MRAKLPIHVSSAVRSFPSSVWARDLMGMHQASPFSLRDLQSYEQLTEDRDKFSPLEAVDEGIDAYGGPNPLVNGLQRYQRVPILPPPELSCEQLM